MDDVDSQIIEALQRSRGYAGFFDWPLDRDIAELGVVQSLIKSLEEKGVLFFRDIAIRGRGNDPPDLEAKNFQGQRLAIEVTELVEPLAICENKKNPGRVYAEWPCQAFLSRIAELLGGKNSRFLSLKGGPYPAGYIVVIHTDEPFLTNMTVSNYLAEASFAGMDYINKAYLLLSYSPGVGYPVFELKLI
ncbi:hypothetical protein [Delftia sp. Cs1-4]|uniref:hypothetical protein n=1 Tax=Delftia sp. (strain Cs1-4) TaxID=742013 RepID=UPI0012F50337|nr:hypothetical protein [Delftia sp. Cs1-4]